MLTSFLVLAFALLMVVHGATLSTTYAVRLANNTNLSKYTIGFLVIAVISILPETFISISSAFQNASAFGLGVLLGSNVADLTLVVALVAFLAGRSINVEQKILKSHILYPLILLIPILLGFDGHFTRFEGVSLIIAGSIFYYLTLRSDASPATRRTHVRFEYRALFLLLLGLAMLLLGAYFTVDAATDLAALIGISPVLIGLLVVGLGTTIPEFFFSLKAVKQNHDELAIGDILGTVLADATIVVGILALMNPFSFPKATIYIAGVFMVAASCILFSFMRSGRSITHLETFALLVFWLTFALVEYIVNI